MEALRVLIVDDSRFMRRVLSDVVNSDRAFTAAAAASDGEEAVELALKLQPDLIVMDLEMPRMNGLEALRRIMAARPVPVIMMSAVTDNGIRDTIKALQYGAFDFIRKPDKALHLDIDDVSRHLLERLHAAAAALREGDFRVMPAPEEHAEDQEAAAGPAAETAGAETAAAREEPGAGPVGQEPKERREAHPADGKPKGAAAPAETDARPKTAAHPETNRRAAADLAADAPARAAGRLRRPPESAGPSAGAARRAKQAERADKPAPGETKSSLRPPHAQDREFRPPGLSGLLRPAADVSAAPRKSAADEADHAAEAPPPDAKGKVLRHSAEFQHIVAIGTSTGGPRALHEVLTRLPEDFEAPILVVQHMPPKFTQSLAQRLDAYCALKVREAQQGDLVETGTVYIAPGGWHMRLTREPSGEYRIQLSNEGPRNGHMPSVDVLFESLVGFRNLKRHAVLMTGMGSDGAAGMQKLKQDGSETRIAQSQETCVVYGMPGSAVKLGAANHVVPLQQIASVLLKEIRGNQGEIRGAQARE